MSSRLLAAAVVIFLLAMPAARSSASPSVDCCACLPSDGATTSGPPVAEAIFCGEFLETEGPSEECELLGGKLRCLNEATTEVALDNECRQLLAQEGIACPTAAGVPVAGAGMLLGLAALLGLGGLLTLRGAR
jgi:hypothetical protein